MGRSMDDGCALKVSKNLLFYKKIDADTHHLKLRNDFVGTYRTVYEGLLVFNGNWQSLLEQIDPRHLIEIQKIIPYKILNVCQIVYTRFNTRGIHLKNVEYF